MKNNSPKVLLEFKVIINNKVKTLVSQDYPERIYPDTKKFYELNHKGIPCKSHVFKSFNIVPMLLPGSGSVYLTVNGNKYSPFKK